MELAKKIKDAKKLVEGFRKEGINAVVNEETGAICMDNSNIVKFNKFMESITEIK
ncbi:hypothetical protein [Clostridium estertheticum]|uniref:hypothetical protein n=1 Tax=Clostridium estertheticum TaxID=238834 RepID=UPI001C6DF560|nr:hypothetical protein [Clostridium estertheticum]MBW9154261.1 hypothetical protein [Clostridium estertheticum]WLC86688.1 hypothetical protein KTC97_21950 [Clostridium estertheticum]